MIIIVATAVPLLRNQGWELEFTATRVQLNKGKFKSSLGYANGQQTFFHRDQVEDLICLGRRLGVH